MDSNTNKLDKIILGTSPRTKGERPQLPSLNALSEAHRNIPSGCELSEWFERVIDKLKQYIIEFNRALPNESLAVIHDPVSTSKHHFKSKNSVLEIELLATTIEFNLERIDLNSIEQIGCLLNESEHSHPSQLNFAEEIIELRSLTAPLRRLFGIFIEAIAESVERDASAANASTVNETADTTIYETISTSLNDRSIDAEQPDLVIPHDVHRTPLTALLEPGAHPIAISPVESTSLFNAFAPAQESLTHEQIEEEFTMLQSKEITIQEAFDQVRNSLERELSSCAKHGANAFESRDVVAIQVATARMVKVEALRSHIDESLTDWAQKLSNANE